MTEFMHMDNFVSEILGRDIFAVERDFPQIIRFFGGYGILFGGRKDIPLGEYINTLPDSLLDDIGIDRRQLQVHLEFFLTGGYGEFQATHTVTIIGGHDKFGNEEHVRLDLSTGSITGIVGPTGSGKSRLLADIEWMAQNDTPTGRTILINGTLPDIKDRFSPQRKLVAQLSQNMNFVMDATVAEFIHMHAESRLHATNDNHQVINIIEQANRLAGEAFTPDASLTSLSGGQSRALMIADTAFLSASPIVLIDEIENAGIDRKQALDLLVSREKIVLMATHDPILALMADRRLVIKNGGIYRIIPTSDAEKQYLTELERIDNRLQQLKQRLRTGETLI
ncbi:MAG: ATP-binding cassette domain-containing protein [Bacteroidales bacterium]|nr:ATP-binding cassette domain-containing protein [Bacteroidales bacterium]